MRNFGLVKKLNNEGLSAKQIQEYLMSQNILVAVLERTSAIKLPSSSQKKSSFFSVLRNVFTKTKDEPLNNGKFKPLELKFNIDLNESKLHKSYSTEFRTELFYYISSLNKNLINSQFQLLSRSFNNKIEVHSNQSKIDEIIKKSFIGVYREIVGQYSSLENEKLETADEIHERKPYFFYLNKKQKVIIDRIEEYPILIDSYLDGDENLIRKELLSTCKIIQDIIDFNYRYKFLVALNKKYNIENANEVIIDEIYHKVYNEYSSLFASIDAVIYAYDKINGFTEYIPSNASALYYALFESNLISKNKTEYQRYLLKIHNVKFGKIRKDSSPGLTPFKKRFNDFNKEISVHFPSDNR
ncbi:hypothetical protein [Algibacter mikhailovii]|uniref:Uncharacterized protein n=1 Tax=Algibacter mikhailovii TaxID=425498 RepID=A0A918QU85_9FLAO|nr:hypothetical protein [Algibacter mikhailovii]GGZ72598.1 hypothetical protein GCM10007028_07030 [Algibacter mikhailovii]